MAIRITGVDAKDVSTSMFNKITAEQAKKPGDRSIKTWEVEGSAHAFTLTYTPSNWGGCGEFRSLILDDETLLLRLRVADDHDGKGEQWPDLMGALHGDLLQLLMNHFRNEAFSKGAVVTTTWTVYDKSDEKKKGK